MGELNERAWKDYLGKCAEDEARLRGDIKAAVKESLQEMGFGNLKDMCIRERELMKRLGIVPPCSIPS